MVRLGLWCGRAPWQRGSSGARLLTQWNQRERSSIHGPFFFTLPNFKRLLLKIDF